MHRGAGDGALVPVGPTPSHAGRGLASALATVLVSSFGCNLDPLLATFN
jgi:hypothetical protein